MIPPQPLSQHRSIVTARITLLACLALLLTQNLWGHDAGDSSLPTTCCPTPQSVPPRPGDDLWMISTRHLSCLPTDKTDPNLNYQKYEPGLGWVESSHQEFQKSGDKVDAPTYIYVHGNRMDTGWSYRRSWTAYHAIAPRASGKIRFVFWSWPSDRVKGLIKDVRLKADRTQNDSYYLGWLLSEMKPNAKVGILAYSFGARISTGALHLHGDGELCGWKLKKPATDKQRRVKLVTMAAAMHNHWLSGGFPHDRAPKRIEHMRNLYNPCDTSLKRYRFITPCSDPVALGFAGIYDRAPLEGRISEVNVSHLIGGEHSPAQYLCNPTIMSRVWEKLKQE